MRYRIFRSLAVIVCALLMILAIPCGEGLAESDKTGTDPFDNVTAADPSEKSLKGDNGTIEITKTVEGAPANDKVFKFTVQNQYGQYIKADGTATSDRVELSIKDGGKATIPNLPVGYYTVSELIGTTFIKDYTLLEDVSTTGTGRNPVELTAGGTETVSLINVYEQDLGSVKVTKLAIGAPDDGLAFRIALKQEETGYYYTMSGLIASESTKWVTIRNHEYVTWVNLPVGWYFLEEDEAGAQIEGMALQVYGSSGSLSESGIEVVKDAVIQTMIVNNYTGEKGSLMIEKTFEGLTEGIDTSGLKFVVSGKLPDGSAYEQTIYYSQFNEDHKYKVDVPVGTYSVTEYDADMLIAQWTIIAASVDGRAIEPAGFSEIESAEKQVTSGSTVRFVFVNEYEPDVGSLKIDKFFSGLPEGLDPTTLDLSFILTDADGNLACDKDGRVVGSFTIADFASDPLDPYYLSYTVSNLPVGRYTVTEEGADSLIENYTLLSTSDTEESGEVEKDSTLILKLKNDYELGTGWLRVEKDFIGVPDDIDPLMLEITFSLKDAENKPARDADGSDVSTFSMADFSYDETNRRYYYIIDNLVPGTYTVEENDPDNVVIEHYTLDAAASKTRNTAVINSVIDPTVVSLINIYEKDVGSLRITKTFGGEIPESADLSGLNFHVEGPEGFAPADISYAAFTKASSDGRTGTYTLENLPMGVYMVRETNAGTLIADYVLTAASTTVSTVTIAEDGQMVPVSLINRYEPKLGSLTIRKEFEGVYEADLAGLTFRVLGPNGYEKILTYGTDFANGQLREPLTGLKPGDYLVYETNAGTLFADMILLPESVTSQQMRITGEGDEAVTVTLKNMYEITKTSVSIIKEWDDQGNLDGSRPEYIVMHLMNGDIEVTSVVLRGTNSDDDTWSAEVDNLDVMDAEGNLIEYTWVEDPVAGYELTSQETAGYITVIRNTHVPETVELTVQKIWEDYDDYYTMRPSRLKVRLSTGNDYYLSEDNDWTVTVEGLPKYWKGVEIEYTWTEQNVLGYTLKQKTDRNGITVFTNQIMNPPPDEPTVPEDQLADLVLPASTETIEDYAFEQIDAYSVYIPDGCLYIGPNAFADCPNLRIIRIPANCRIEGDPFAGCGPITIYGVTGSNAWFFTVTHQGVQFRPESEWPY